MIACGSQGNVHFCPSQKMVEICSMMSSFNDIQGCSQWIPVTANILPGGCTRICLELLSVRDVLVQEHPGFHYQQWCVRWMNNGWQMSGIERIFLKVLSGQACSCMRTCCCCLHCNIWLTDVDECPQHSIKACTLAIPTGHHCVNRI